MRGSASGALHFEVRIQDLHAHLFEVRLTVANPASEQVVRLPVWIPGSYLVREFSKSLQNMQAWQGDQAIPARQLDKCSWLLHCTPDQPLQLRYEIYAFDRSVRTAWLDAQRGFFNGTSLFVSVEGQQALPHQLTIQAAGLPASWKVATALAPVRVSARGTGSYQAENYDALVDAPVEMGDFWSGSFKACGIHHRFVVAGAPPNFDGQRLLDDTRRICETEIRFWHGRHLRGKLGPQQRDYLFMLNAEDNGYGGLEHGHSTALICKRADLPQLGQSRSLKVSDGYTTLLGLISHEYFHTWNVKRLRPAEFAHYDYQRENYTELLWFFEGLTSYYDDLLLRRADLIDDSTYLGLLTKTLNSVLQTPGRQVQSVAQASFDAWVKYYRQDENTPNHTVSYYTKGALVGLCLDLSLRQSGQTSLDAVMCALWRHCAGGPMTHDDVLAVLHDLSGQSFATRLQAWVHGTEDLPVTELLQTVGVDTAHDTAPMAERLGVRVNEQQGVQIKVVLRGSAAEAAGFCAGDEWLGIKVGTGRKAQGWRLSKLDELPLYLGAHRACTALVSRDKRLLELALTLPDPLQRLRLNVQDGDKLAQWLCAAKA